MERSSRLIWLVVAVTTTPSADAKLRRLQYEGPLRQEEVFREKEEQWRKVEVFKDVWVSCKGQVVTRKGEEEGDLSIAQYHWDGCGQSEGHCSQPDWIRPETPREMNPGGPVDVIVLLTQPQWGAYYHFVIDSLSRLAWVNDQYPEVVDDPKTFFHIGYVNSVGRTWAKLVGIKAAEDTEVERLLDGWWKAGTVYFPPTNKCANMKVGAEPHAISWMSETVAKNVQVQAADFTCAQYRAGKAGLALLVRRDERKSRNRAVLNHDEVLAATEEELPGWSVHVFSDYPSPPGILETCKIFSCADLIIGPHGAGFANLICSKKGTPVVEFQQKYHSWDFELLTMKKGMPYFGLPGVFEDHYGAGTVNVEQLREQLKQALLKALPGDPNEDSPGKALPEPKKVDPAEDATKTLNASADASKGIKAAEESPQTAGNATDDGQTTSGLHHFHRHFHKTLGNALMMMAMGLSQSTANYPDVWMVGAINFVTGVAVGAALDWIVCRRNAAPRGLPVTPGQLL